VVETGRKLAELKGLSVEAVAEATTTAAARVYRFALAV
jgi:Tat protein secretion system quality control protein TatD with DNase activity